MTNLYKNKNLTCFFLLALAVSLFSLGCGSMSVEKRATLSYDGMGMALETAQSTLNTICGAGVLSAEECEEARLAYNDAVSIYKLMRNPALAVIDGGSNAIYGALSKELMGLLVVINKYTGGQ